MAGGDVSGADGVRGGSVVRDSLGPFAVSHAPTAVESTTPRSASAAARVDGVDASDGGGKRDKALVIRLTEAELELLHGSARREGRGKTAAWARDVLVTRAAGRQWRAERESPALNAARGELVRIGNNVNQIARVLNGAVRNGEVVAAGEVLRVLQQVRGELAATREMLRADVVMGDGGGVP